jgi:HECT-like Ubiquitin-conjugating enzyme (E2)-binding
MSAAAPAASAPPTLSVLVEYLARVHKAQVYIQAPAHYLLDCRSADDSLRVLLHHVRDPCSSGERVEGSRELMIPLPSLRADQPLTYTVCRHSDSSSHVELTHALPTTTAATITADGAKCAGTSGGEQQTKQLDLETRELTYLREASSHSWPGLRCRRCNSTLVHSDQEWRSDDGAQTVAPCAVSSSSLSPEAPSTSSTACTSSSSPSSTACTSSPSSTACTSSPSSTASPVSAVSASHVSCSPTKFLPMPSEYWREICDMWVCHNEEFVQVGRMVVLSRAWLSLSLFLSLFLSRSRTLFLSLCLSISRTNEFSTMRPASLSLSRISPTLSNSLVLPSSHLGLLALVFLPFSVVPFSLASRLFCFSTLSLSLSLSPLFSLISYCRFCFSSLEVRSSLNQVPVWWHRAGSCCPVSAHTRTLSVCIPRTRHTWPGGVALVPVTRTATSGSR